MNAMSVIFSTFIPEEGQKDPHAGTCGDASVLSKTRSTAGFCSKEDRGNMNVAFKIKTDIFAQFTLYSSRESHLLDIFGF